MNTTFKMMCAVAMMVSSTMSFAQGEMTISDNPQALMVPPADEALADSSWKTGGTVGLNLSQVHLENWASGGQSSVSASGLVNLFANYTKGKGTWDNTLDFAYGLLRQGQNGVVLKTDDRIDLASKYGHKAAEHWYYSALLNFRSQFAPGYNLVDGVPDKTNLISDFLSPAYMLASLGMDYKPNDKFTAFLSPTTYKMTVVMDSSLSAAGAFGVDPGTNVRSEIGGYVRMAYNTNLVENVGLTTRIDLFSNYLNNPENIDINWEVLISMKVNKFMSATISTQLLYDDDVTLQKKDPIVEDDVVIDSGRGPGVQFKEVLAIGFSYKF
ncbi:MAG: DUF3078 domain-containing protein [Flavobacteriales bacterium]|nr:DUF3078 domain-containing protein [Flavobacteriales bacterium]